MARVLVVGRIVEQGLAVLREAGHEVVTLEEGDAAALEAALPGTEAILVRTMPLLPAQLDRATGLRIVSRHGVGYDNVPVDHLTARGVAVAIAASANKVAVAEHAFWMILELLKRGREHDRAVRAGDWRFRARNAALEAAGRRLLLVGCGRIGAELGRRAAAFDMSVVVHDPYAGAVPFPIEPDLDAALAGADVVSLHLPLTAETRGLISAARLALLRPEAIVVNTARGGLVDEAALAAALREGRLRGAGIDVFADEPPPADHPLLGLDNALLTPHSGGITAESAVRMAVESARNIVDHLAGRLDPAVCVNRSVLG
jgi:D-3-phosphoglycerate dehydrogenase